jgi:hypothetical protein
VEVLLRHEKSLEHAAGGRFEKKPLKKHTCKHNVRQHSRVLTSHQQQHLEGALIETTEDKDE